MQETLKGLNNTLRRCAYTAGEELRGCLKSCAKQGGCSLSLLNHNIRSARGPGLELLEAEIRRWGIAWEVKGLTETWLDAESEKRISVNGYKAICASRTEKSGGGVAVLIREDLTYRERPDLAIFKEGIIESTFIEIVRSGSNKNDVVEVIYRPPAGDVCQFNEELGKILEKTKNETCYVIGDFDVQGFSSERADY